jgi:hypothetical protein
MHPVVSGENRRIPGAMKQQPNSRSSTMSTFSRNMIAAAAIAASIAGLQPALAQSGAAAGGSYQASPADHAQRVERMKQRMADRLAQLHSQLGLNNAQEAAWNTFVARMQPRVDTAARPAAPPAALSVPERMERQLAMMQATEKQMAERLAATKEFYAVLTPDQQKTFNESFPVRGGRYGHH